MGKDVQNQIEELESRIQNLRTTQAEELRQKLKQARHEVARLEAELGKLTGKPTAASPVSGRRQRTPSAEIRDRINQALAAAPKGLGQKEISDATGLNYNTVVLYLKNHQKEFKSTGTRRTKRFLLKNNGPYRLF